MPAQQRQRNPALLQGVLLFLLAALIGLALATRNAERPACGPLADALADGLVTLLGPILAWGLWALLPPIAICWAAGRRKRTVLARGLPLLPAVLAVSLLVHPFRSLRGRLGLDGFALFERLLGPWGSWIALVGLLLLALWLPYRLLLPASWRAALGRIRLPRLPRLRRVSRVRSGRAEQAPEREAEGGLKLVEPIPKIAEAVGGKRAQPVRAMAAEPEIRERRSAPRPVRRSGAARKGAGDWKLPEVDLLEDLDGTRAAIDREEILETSSLLVRTLKDFGVQGKVGEVHPGPVVTRYEYEPAPGVRVSQIVHRVDDISLALRAESIRLVAPIPGKAAVGIEVPNRRPALISLKEILEADDFRRRRGPLLLALGREISGSPVYARLDTMPHLLVAGTTGSGKSVCLNALLISLLFRHTPEELRFLLIDPKRLELTPYEGIPALLCPVVTEARRATRMLEWLCGEMDRRYRLFQQVGAKGIEGYRQKAEAEEGGETVPHIVVVVDELADLMTTQRTEIEGPISRLAHMARAVGIHMIFATQRPSVDVLTGVVKANFPVRIAFKVASRIDSRTILDAGGAEFLLGRGDMLFLPPGKADAIRVHGAYTTEGDAERLAGFLREQPAAPGLFVEEAEGQASSPAREDEMFEEALRLVIRERQASVSFLQRRLKVGYARAARLMDLLEAAGVVSPYDGSKAREVMVDERYLEEWDGRQGSRDG